MTAPLFQEFKVSAIERNARHLIHERVLSIFNYIVPRDIASSSSEDCKGRVKGI